MAQAEALEDRSLCLERALDRLCHCDQSLLRTLAHLERGIARRIIEHWQERVTDSLRTLRSRAQLEVRLVTRHVILADQITLALEISNIGYGPATAVAVDLLPSQACYVVDGSRRIDLLWPGQSVTVKFIVELMTSTTIQPCFRICFDDATQADTVRTFMPMVTLMAIPI